FMKQHQDRFDDRLMRERSELIGNLPLGSDSSKVRAGEVGNHKRELTPRLKDELDQRWREFILPATGFKHYNDFQKAIVELTG
ncbi:MAG: sulfotransferase domain-containing protein, partial [Chloroflexota bacterium]